MNRAVNFVRNIVAVALLCALAIGHQGCGLYADGIGCGDGGDQPCQPTPVPEQSGPNTYTCSCSCKEPSVDWQVRVMASDDDAEEHTDTGSVSLTGVKLDIPFAGNTAQHVGVRFAGVTIPPKAHIVNAYVQFTSAADAPDPVSITITGEASDDAAPFGSAAKDLSARQFTQTTVSWTPPAWKIDAQGPEEMTPSLTNIIQEIVNQPGWGDGNAIVLMMTPQMGTKIGSRAAYSFDAQPMNAPQLVVTFDDPNAEVIGPQDMPVCMTEEMNPNLNGGHEPDGDKMQNDCQYRVGKTFAGLAAACGYPSNCGCVAIAGSKQYSDKCDDKCVENPVDPQCTNFDPKNKVVEATNAPGDPIVCQANCPLSFSMFGQRSECQVEGTAHMSIAGEQVEPPVRGVVQFRGAPCPEGNCPVGMEYRLNVDDVRFETLFHSETFEELTGLGESIPGNDAVLSRGGGTFAPGDLVMSARGRRGREQQAFTIDNASPVDIDVKFGSSDPRCAIRGKMIAGSDAAGAPTLALGLELEGRIVNQPPTANAGKDQTVQCPAAVTLDGSASSDPDGNIAVYSWLQGGRAGKRVGARQVSDVEQRPGKETYVLRVIDARGQTDEDTTDVTVVDTLAPRVKCAVRSPILTSPTGAMTNVGFRGAARDTCEGVLPVQVDVFSDEAATRTRDRKPASDAEVSPGALKLRQDRQSTGDGRVYLIRVAASDSAGNQGVDCCTVVVPHDGSRNGLLAADKQAKAARSFCLAGRGAVPSGFVPVGSSVKTGR